MKRLLALAALALAASACSTTTTNTNTGAVNANANVAATPVATATPAGPTQADLEAKERQIWESIKAKNWDAFGGMLADDFAIVGSDGVMTKTQMLGDMKKYDLTEFTLSDFRMVKVDADLAILTYTATEKSSYDGKPTPGKPTHASSAWVNRDGKWLAAYHQESDAVAMPAASPTPATAASPAASPATAASPAASPAAIASATDAEKAVWDAIKAKNADAFGSYMLPDAIEVEPEGVMDKATSVKMITTFDASKWSLSEFKETKLDADATLITYKAAGPDHGKTIGMYHSTIWTNRGGQWKAAFHQGTLAGKGGM